MVPTKVGLLFEVVRAGLSAKRRLIRMQRLDVLCRHMCRLNVCNCIHNLHTYIFRCHITSWKLLECFEQIQSKQSMLCRLRSRFRCGIFHGADAFVGGTCARAYERCDRWLGGQLCLLYSDTFAHRTFGRADRFATDTFSGRTLGVRPSGRCSRSCLSACFGVMFFSCAPLVYVYDEFMMYDHLIPFAYPMCLIVGPCIPNFTGED